MRSFLGAILRSALCSAALTTRTPPRAASSCPACSPSPSARPHPSCGPRTRRTSRTSCSKNSTPGSPGRPRARLSRAPPSLRPRPTPGSGTGAHPGRHRGLLSHPDGRITPGRQQNCPTPSATAHRERSRLVGAVARLVELEVRAAHERLSGTGCAAARLPPATVGVDTRL